ncbi:MAG: glucose-6-phosphate dehydrogenase assembly protein OpcA [Ktedonobacteraceae bacterium]
MTKEATNSLRPRLPWAGKSVPVENVEEELALLWKISADNMRIGQNSNVRTSVLNLVICAPDIESAQRASALLRELSSTHLARVAVIILDRGNDTPAAIFTWITLRCFSVISDMMRHCFEQTTLLTTGNAVRSTANILQPLLKPHLPTYLWWIGEPPDNDSIFNSLIEFSNRVIVDSTGFFNPEQDIHTLAMLRQAAPECALSDLNWGRITPWRQLIVQFFDVMEYRPYLDGVTSIEIEHAAAPFATPTLTELGDVSPNPTCALLLAGWLKARLDWSLVDDKMQHTHDTASGTYHWTLERTTNVKASRILSSARGKTSKTGNIQTINIAIRPQIQSNMRPGSICLVRLTSNVEGKQATFTINREGDPDHALTSVELSKEVRPQRTVILAATHKESELLHDELEIMGHDHLFEQTLQEVAELLS